MSFKLVKTTILGLILILVCSCDEPDLSAVSGTSSSGSTTTTTPDITDTSDSSVLYLAVNSNWKSNTTVTQQQVCSIPLGSAVGTSISCTVAMPEAQLYYSDMSFVTGTADGTACPIVVFKPYYYLRIAASTSGASTYTPHGATSSIDCTASPLPSACFGGAAPVILGSAFPTNRSTYYLAANATTTTYTLPSEDTTRWYYGFPTNLASSNDKPSASRSVATAQSSTGDLEYAANTFQDYVLECEDIYAHPIYTITLTVQDVNISGGGTSQDEVEDWNSSY